MKSTLSKGFTGSNPVGIQSSTNLKNMLQSSNIINSHNDFSSNNTGHSNTGYVTEKLYMLLQLYLQNKSWNPSAEILQYFSDLKDSATIPNAAYLQTLGNRLTLDSQGRLILRESGKIVLPYEHFANAVMLKHMSGPHGLHLSVDATIRAVIESYTIGRENFGMEKEFIFEVIHSCPNAPCRYYKNYIGVSPLQFMDQQFSNMNSELLPHVSHLPTNVMHASHLNSGIVSNNLSSNNLITTGRTNVNNSLGSECDVDLLGKVHQHQTKMSSQLQELTKQHQNNIQSQLSQISAAAAAVAVVAKQQHHQQQHAPISTSHQQQHFTAALLQHQNRALNQKNLENCSGFTGLDKQRVLCQLDLNKFDPNVAAMSGTANMQLQNIMQSQTTIGSGGQGSAVLSTSSNFPISNNLNNGNSRINNNNYKVNGNHHSFQQQLSALNKTQSMQTLRHDLPVSVTNSVEQIVQKSVDNLRSNLETLESNKDLLTLHNGVWTTTNQDFNSGNICIGQDKIIVIFAELMRNMARIKTYIRPAMCKPYGKQSESLQKTLVDTIQIIQTLRSFLPAPHIPVTSWKSESEGSLSHVNITGGSSANAASILIGMGNSVVTNTNNNLLGTSTIN